MIFFCKFFFQRFFKKEKIVFELLTSQFFYIQVFSQVLYYFKVFVSFINL